MYRLLTGRSPVQSFSRTINNQLLGECEPENHVWINTKVARSLPGFDEPLQSGDPVVLVNQDGVRSDPIPARVTERIRGDCVYLIHGYGQRAPKLKYANRRGGSVSRLTTRYATDPIMGGTGMNVNFVSILPPEVPA